MILVWGKARSHRAPNLGYGGLSHLGDLMFHQKPLHKTWCISGCIAVMKLPITSFHSCTLPNHPNSFCRWMFKFNGKFDADPLLYLLSHFEWESHTVHMLTQRCLLHPLTSTVKLSLFIHEHSSPFSLAARLYQCRANHSRYISDGWTSPGQTSSYIHI